MTLPAATTCDLTPVHVVEAEWTHDGSRRVTQTVELDWPPIVFGIMYAFVCIPLFERGRTAEAVLTLVASISWCAMRFAQRRRALAWLRAQGRAADPHLPGHYGLVRIDLGDRFGIYATDFGILSLSDDAITFEGAQTSFSLCPSRWKCLGGPIEIESGTRMTSPDWPDRRIAFSSLVARDKGFGKTGLAMDRDLRAITARGAVPEVAQAPPGRSVPSKWLRRRPWLGLTSGGVGIAIACSLLFLNHDPLLRLIDYWVVGVALLSVPRHLWTLMMRFLRDQAHRREPRDGYKRT